VLSVAFTLRRDRLDSGAQAAHPQSARSESVAVNWAALNEASPDGGLSLRRDGGAIALLILLLIAIHPDLLLLGNQLFWGDLTLYHFPMKKVVHDQILAGTFPLWNPLYSLGQPLAANPAYEVFYPPQWLTLLPDYAVGFRLHILVHVYLAAVGFYLLARTLGVRVHVAFLGAAAFVLGGPFVSFYNYLPFMFSLTWMPWIALFTCRYLRSSSIRDLVPATLFLGLQALICEPTSLLQTWMLLGIGMTWYRATAAADRRAAVRGAWRGVVEAVAMVVAGVALAAVQFLPALDFAKDTVRGHGFDWSTTTQWSFPPLRALELAFPQLLGSMGGGGASYWGGALYGRNDTPFLASIYPGVLFVALAFAGLAARRRGWSLMSIVVVVALALATGSRSPIFHGLYELGLLSSVRYPEKFLLMANSTLLVFSCLVLEDVLAGARRFATIGVVFLSATVVGAAAVLGWAYSDSYQRFFGALWHTMRPELIELSRSHWLMAVVRGVVFCLALLLVARWKRQSAAMGVLAIALLVDLAPLGLQLVPRMPRRFFDEPPLVASVDACRGDGRLFHEAAMRRLQEGVGYFRGYDTFWTYRNGLFPMLPAAWGIPTALEYDVDHTHLVETNEMLTAASIVSAARRDWMSVLGPTLGVGCVATFRPSAPEIARAGGDWSLVNPVSLHPVEPFPRYFFASQAVPVSQTPELVSMLVENDWPPRTAFTYGARPRTGAARVLGVRESPHSVQIEFEAEQDAFLVAGITHHRYWQARVDGVELPILRTNIAIQGIQVPKGRHTLLLEYSNPMIPLGASVSGLALLLLLTLFLRGQRLAGHGN
jgi:hypothetical protein